MTLKLPKAIQAYFDADNARSADAVAGAFTDDAVVKDAGETRVGRDSIHTWKLETDRKYALTLVEPFFMTTENGRTQVTGHVSGTFPGSPIDLRYFFVLKADKIAELEITV